MAATGSVAPNRPDRSYRGLNTWQASWRLIRAQPGLFAASAGSWLVIFHTHLVPGLVSKLIFDHLTQGATLAAAPWVLIMLAMCMRLLRVALHPVAAWIYATHQWALGSTLRTRLLASIMGRPGAVPAPVDEDGNPISSSEALSRFRDDVQQPVLLVADITVDQTGIWIRTLVVLAIMCSIDARLALLTVLPLMIVSAVVNAAGRRLENYRRASRMASGAVSGFIGEMFDKAAAIKVAGAEDRVSAHFDILNERRRRADLADTLLRELLTTGLGNTQELGLAMVLLLAARSLAAQTFTVGDLALFVSFLPTVTHSLDGFAQYIIDHRRTAVALDRLRMLLAGAPVEMLFARADDAQDLSRPVGSGTDTRLEGLEVTGLTYHHPGTTQGITDITFRIARGSLTVITGRVGSGKTTVLRALLGLLPADSGQVRWNGAVVTDAASFFTPPRCAYTPQVPRLFSASLRDNILLGWPANSDCLKGAVHAAVMEADVQELAHGLDTVVGARGVRLSGGQLQRAAAARMFVRDAELLVMDDLSSALDVDTEACLWQRQAGRSAGGRPTRLVVSHRRAALRIADHVIVLADGRIADQGSLAALLVRCPEMQAVWDSG